MVPCISGCNYCFCRRPHVPSSQEDRVLSCLQQQLLGTCRVCRTLCTLGRAVISPDLSRHMFWVPAAWPLATETMNVVGGVAVAHGCGLTYRVSQVSGAWYRKSLSLLTNTPVTHCEKVAAHPHTRQSLFIQMSQKDHPVTTASLSRYKCSNC